MSLQKRESIIKEVVVTIQFRLYVKNSTRQHLRAKLHIGLNKFLKAVLKHRSASFLQKKVKKQQLWAGPILTGTVALRKVNLFLLQIPSSKAVICPKVKQPQVCVNFFK